MVVQVLCSQLVGVDRAVVAGIECDMVAANKIECRLGRLLTWICLLSHEEGPLPNHTSLARSLCNAVA